MRYWICALFLAGLLAGCSTFSTTSSTSSHSLTTNAVTAAFALNEDESDNFVTSMCFLDGSLWIGTEHSVYEVKYDKTTKKFEMVKHHTAAVEDGRVNALRTDGEAIVIATSEGYGRYERDSWLRHPTGNTNDVLRVGNALWSATNNGIERLRDGTREWRSFEVTSATDYSPTQKMTCLATDNAANVWVGTQFGVHHFALDSYQQFMAKLKSGGAGTNVDSTAFWKRYFGDYQNPTGGLIANEQGNCPLSGNVIVAIRYHAPSKRFLFCTKRGLTTYDGTTWHSLVGTHSEYIMNAEGRLDRRQVQGNIAVPTPEVYDVVIHNQLTYLATRSGLAIVQPDRSAKMVTMEQGLPSNKARALSIDPATSTLFVGTENGIAALQLAHPES